ncbi:MAG: hypothetical protein ACTSPV_11590 [Candidatus Hodarchaeales archaeon]
MNQKNIDIKAKYEIPFSRVGKYFQLFLFLSIVMCFAFWTSMTFSKDINKTLLPYLMLSMIIFLYCFFTGLILFISGNGVTELTITTDSIMVKRIFNPFFVNYFKRATSRRALIRDIEMLEISKQSVPNWILMFIGLMLFLIGFLSLLLGSIFQLDFSFVPIIFTVLGIVSLLYSILFARRNFYQFKILFNRPGLFFPFFENINSYFLSSGIWVIRGYLGDAKKLYEDGQTIISSLQSN